MHLLVDISAHGLGHLSQSGLIIEALNALNPKIQITVRSALPLPILKRVIGINFNYLPHAVDIGFVMHNAVDIDFSKSAAAYRSFHANWQQRVHLESKWLSENRIDGVLTNAAYLSLAAANHAKIPSACLCSLNWAELFGHYLGKESWANNIHQEILSAYQQADVFLRVTPGLPMENLPNRKIIGPIARIGKSVRSELAHQLHLPEGNRWILISMGGMDFPIALEKWEKTPGVNWIVPAASYIDREDVRSFDAIDIAFPNVLASVDAVVTKPGYGIFAEAACSGIPILYLEREDWPETAPFAQWLQINARSQTISRRQFEQGNFIDELIQIWEKPPPKIPSANGVEDALELLSSLFGLA